MLLVALFPWWLLVTASAVLGVSVTKVQLTTLATDPEGSARLNGESFQQSVISTFNGWQYVAFYSSTGTYAQNRLNIARRQVTPTSATAWQTISFTDYTQTTIDGHNTISLGICPGDGSIHISFDHHDVPLNYRFTGPGVATNPSTVNWSSSLFSSTQHSLPGASGPWTPLTYPRFEPVPSTGELLFEFRIGQSGAGDSYIYRYTPSNRQWQRQAKYLQGSNNNAYINGLDFLNGRLHATWTWRETPDVITNHDLCYAYSEDLGKTWKSSPGGSLGSTISPSSPGITVFAIPQRSGILNQEGQAVDAAGNMHVLNRENREAGYKWYHYLRTPSGAWSRNVINVPNLGAATPTGYRGKLAVVRGSGELLAIIPEQSNGEVKVLASTPEGGFRDWKQIWVGTSYNVDPLVDKNRVQLGEGGGGVLSLFLRHSGPYPSRKVLVVDLTLGP